MKTVLFAVLLLAAACIPEKPKTAEIAFEKSDIEISRAAAAPLKINVELAQTDAQRERGLMYRTEMADDAGMLFDFKTPRRIGMWMANTAMSLDMFFIDSKGVIRQIAEYTVPFSRDVILSEGDMLGVLEMKAGSAQRFGISEGDIVRHAVFDVEK